MSNFNDINAMKLYSPDSVKTYLTLASTEYKNVITLERVSFKSEEDMTFIDLYDDENVFAKMELDEKGFITKIILSNLDDNILLDKNVKRVENTIFDEIVYYLE